MRKAAVGDGLVLGTFGRKARIYAHENTLAQGSVAPMCTQLRQVYDIYA